MRLTCPACGACGSLEFFLMDAAAHHSVMQAFQLQPVLAKQVMAYLGLFRPGKRALTWDRVEKLLAELIPFISEAKVERNGSTWAAPVDYWQAAFDQLLTGRDKLRLPLKSHGYLFEVVAGLASRAAGKAEQDREQQNSYRYHRDSSGLEPVAALVSAAPKPEKKGPPQGWKQQAFNQGQGE